MSQRRIRACPGQKKTPFHKDAFFITLCIIWSIILYGCADPYGLRAEYPKRKLFIDDYVIVDSLQPTLQWESFPRDQDLTGKNKISGQVSDVTYQLRISAEDWYYSRDDLPEPYHRIEVLLSPATRYFWAVRACFKLNGEPRCTVWSSLNYWGYAACRQPNPSSYRFETPAK